jgi:hypothetical protein
MKTDLTHSGSGESRSGFQFSLRTFLLAITAIALILAWYFYYRQVSVMVNVKMGIIETTDLNLLVAGCDVSSNDDSPYEFVILNNARLEKLLDTTEVRFDSLYDEDRLIQSWPYHAVAATYIQSNLVHLSDAPKFSVFGNHSGFLTGTLGVRLAGGRELQIHVDCQAGYQTQQPTYVAKKLDWTSTELRGRLEYEGFFPEGALLFLAKLDDAHSYIVLFSRRRTPERASPNQRSADIKASSTAHAINPQ